MPKWRRGRWPRLASGTLGRKRRWHVYHLRTIEIDKKNFVAKRTKSLNVFLLRSLALGVAVYWGTGSMVTRYLL